MKHRVVCGNITDTVYRYPESEVDTPRLREHGWPVMLYLHGGGENVDRRKSRDPTHNWPPAFADEVPVIVVAPHLIGLRRDGANGWAQKRGKQFETLAVFDAALQRIRAEIVATATEEVVASVLGKGPDWSQQPIFLAGSSFGGGGALFLAAEAPDRWDKIVLVCPKAPDGTVEKAALIEAPVRVYQNAHDGTAQADQFALKILDEMWHADVPSEADFYFHAAVLQKGSAKAAARVKEWLAEADEPRRYRRHTYNAEVYHHNAWAAAFSRGKFAALSKRAQDDLYDWLLTCD